MPGGDGPSVHDRSTLPHVSAPTRRHCHLPQNLASILKKPGVKKKPFLVRNQEDVLLCARNMNTDSLAPIFLTSAVTGERAAVPWGRAGITGRALGGGRVPM